jgi:flagellar basal body rod protein FlgC
VYDRKPLDATNNTIKVLTEDDFEKQYAPVRDFKSGSINIIRYYAPTNPQADTSGYVYKQVLQEPEP